MGLGARLHPEEGHVAKAITDGTTGSGRIVWLDAARGIGILLVVIGHVERGLVSANIAGSHGWSTFDTMLYTFHMPLFMLLAGMNVPVALQRGTGRFVAERMRSVAYPYLLWSLVQGTFLVLLSRFANNGAAWSDLAQIGWKPMSQFWFLYALMAYLLLVAVVGLRPFILLGLALVALVAGASLDILSIGYRLCYFLIFFVAGILLSQPIKALRPRQPLLWALPLAVAWLACLPLVLASGGAVYQTLKSLPPAFLGSATVMLVALGLSGAVQAAFVRLGKWSMSIYVMHILAAAGTRIAMVRLHLGAPPILYLVAGVIVGILLPVIAHLILDRCGLLPALGLGKMQRRPAEIIPERITGDFAQPST